MNLDKMKKDELKVMIEKLQENKDFLWNERANLSAENNHLRKKIAKLEEESLQEKKFLRRLVASKFAHQVKYTDVNGKTRIENVLLSEHDPCWNNY